MNSVQSAAAAFNFEGQLVDLQLPGGPVHVTVRLDHAVHVQRTNAGIGPILDRSLVTALWELPEGLQVPVTSIPSWALERLDSARDAVERAGSSYVHVARPATVVTGAVAVGRDLPRLLARVGQLSAVAPMGLVRRGGVESSDACVLNAALYGVGVAAFVNSEVEVILEPQAVRPTPGPFLWWTAELAYAEILDNLSRAGPTR